jgi:hypothetical protein
VGSHGTVLNTLALGVSPGQTNYQLNVSNLNATGVGGVTAPGGLYQLIIIVTATNPTSLVTDPANASGSATTAQQVNLVFSPLTGGFVSPAVGHFLGLGNVTVVIQYGGDFVQNAAVTVYKGTTPITANIVFTSPTFAPGAGNHTVAAINPWVATSSGEYLMALYVNASYTNQTFTQTVNVTASGTTTVTQTIWLNTTHYNNQSTIIPGLSNQVSGTLLLVIGLVVGLLVALVLGRMMWGTPKQAAPQQWQAKPGMNECSVCHQQFPTEDALKEHQKTAHGMG